MQVKGIIHDMSNLNEIRELGFTKFRVLDDEMHYEDEDDYFVWLNAKESELDKFTTNYMCGQDDAKLYYFSDKEEVQEEIQRLFPTLRLVTVESDYYPMDYDYTR